MEIRQALDIYLDNREWDEAWECVRLLWEEEKDRESVLKFREAVKKDISEDTLVLYRKSYDLCARDSFDDFMLALEWNREPSSQFWLPRRQKLYQICECLQDLEDGKLDELFISQPPRTGKALADDTPILTRSGWKNHGDLVVGDEVIGMDGKFKKVLAVHPKCMLDRLVTFTNGEQIVCHENHEWLLYDRHKQKLHLEETKYWESQELESGEPGKRGHRYHYQMLTKEFVQGEHKELPLDPYSFGVWLGDGTNQNPTIANAPSDHAIIDKMIENGCELRWQTKHKTTGVMSYGFGFRKALQSMGMCHSRRRTEKHIPDIYLTASVEQRLELLAGLLDTDGVLTRKENRYHFCTCDEELRDTFIELIATFGWRVNLIVEEPCVSSSGVHGRKNTYVIGFNPTCYIPCQLERKQLHTFSKQRKVAVKSITKTEPKQGNCITVEGGMYLAGRQMMPTHNSTLVQFFVLWIILRHPAESSLYCTYTESVAKVFYNGLLEILNDPWTYRWKDLFPEREIASTDAKELLLNIDKKNKYASFTGRSLYGSLTGATNASSGGYLIADDLHSGVEEALNPELLNTAWARVTNNFLSRNSGQAKNLWIGTRWSLRDAIARRIDLLENDPQFETRRFRIINVPAVDEDGNSNFDYAFGMGFSTEYFAQVKAGFERNGDIASWDAQFMGLPIERSGTVFEADDLRYYNGVLPEDVEPDRVFVVVDPSWGGGDYCAAVCIYQYDDDLYIHDLVYDNGDKRITQPLIARMCVKHQASAVYVEATKTTNSYSQGLNDLIREYGYRVNMISTTKHWAGNKSKQQRIFDRAPDIRETMIFKDVGYRDKAYQKFMENVFEFKVQGKNSHDDAPDVLAQAIVSVVIGDTKAVLHKRFF